MSSISRHLDFLVVKVIHGKTQELGNVEHTELGVCTKLPRWPNLVVVAAVTKVSSDGFNFDLIGSNSLVF